MGNSTSSRIFSVDDPNVGNSDVPSAAPLLFVSEEPTGDTWKFDQAEDEDGAIYLVQAGAAADGVNAWWSEPTDDLPKGINYEGAGSDGANAAIRVDVEEPAARR